MAVENDKIIGHILFTKIMIGSNVELALAPLSVLPDHQKRGIGSALINEGNRIAKTLGYSYSVVLGTPRVYGKAGDVPAILSSRCQSVRESIRTGRMQKMFFHTPPDWTAPG